MLLRYALKNKKSEIVLLSLSTTLGLITSKKNLTKSLLNKSLVKAVSEFIAGVELSTSE